MPGKLNSKVAIVTGATSGMGKAIAELFAREGAHLILAGRTVLAYAIDGPGLDHRGGTIWFDKTSGILVGFEIEKPDEPGYESGKLVLKKVRRMNPGRWSDFKKAALAGKSVAN